ncbi:restriction endonuclease subunit S [Loktanella sp. DJP18]|uniref:restriction endonuclease subunit S n=1 Tax=Loktanella sp. DJP18 TaxID=3409788 RepID=UPI003BB66067
MTKQQLVDADIVELQELTDPDRPITYGVVKPGPEDRETGVIFIRGGDISNGSINETDLRTITQEVSRPYARTILRGGEVVMSLVGNPGEVAVVPDRLAGANLARQAGLIALRPEIYAPYVKYYLMAPQGRGELFQRTQGAVQQVINLSDLKRVKVRLPSRLVQERIASILSAYDDLIETNRRRITLLEEAARLLYREWFVHFRFPGHEHVKITDGVPDGWERGDFGSVAQLNYGKALKAENRIEGPFPVYGSSCKVGIHEKALVESPAIVVGRKGNVGSVYWCSENFWPIDTAYFISKEQSDYWLYQTLPDIGFQNTDTGVPGLNRDFAYSRKVVVPSENLRREFNLTVEPMFAQVQLLATHNQKLAQARDLLLPRLMNGEVPV